MENEILSCHLTISSTLFERIMSNETNSEHSIKWFSFILDMCRPVWFNYYFIETLRILLLFILNRSDVFTQNFVFFPVGSSKLLSEQYAINIMSKDLFFARAGL